MKKLFFLFLLACLSFTTARSQVLIALVFGDKLNTPNIEFGLNAGANFSTLSDHPDAKYDYGLNFGLYFNFKLSDHFYLHPEFLFIDKMGTRGTDNRDLPAEIPDDETLETWRKLDYMTFIFLPRYKLTNQLYFEAGLQTSLLMTADDVYMIKPEEDSELYYKDFIKNDITRMDVAADVGLGFKFGDGKGVNLSLRYSHGFINTLKDDALPAEYNRAFRVHVGIPIGLGKEDIQNQLDQE
jgi:hypothetical protein